QPAVLGGQLPPPLRARAARPHGARREALGPLRQRAALPPSLRRPGRLRSEDLAAGVGPGRGERGPGLPAPPPVLLWRGLRRARLPAPPGGRHPQPAERLLRAREPGARSGGPPRRRRGAVHRLLLGLL